LPVYLYFNLMFLCYLSVLIYFSSWQTKGHRVCFVCYLLSF
jgi:hypothetical protein